MFIEDLFIYLQISCLILDILKMSSLFLWILFFIFVV